jgi:2-amino-4-hydroxy-6-hydroxymethyldihydropteridine diphosphokinase
MKAGDAGAAGVVAYIGLGSNVGDRHSNLQRARAGIAELGEVLAASGVYETEPWGVTGAQPRYLNQVVKLRTALAPELLLKGLLGIEARLGRARTTHAAPRTIDLDLLLYGDSTADGPGLTVPHPRMHLRGFVLVPLAEIAPGQVIPGVGRTVRDLAHEVGSQGVTKLEVPEDARPSAEEQGGPAAP